MNDLISRSEAITMFEKYGAEDDAIELLKSLPPSYPDLETLIGLAIAVAKPIEFLDLSVRSYNALKRWGITTVAQVYQAKRDGKLNKIRNLGEKSVYEIEHCLNQYLSRWEGGQD